MTSFEKMLIGKGYEKYYYDINNKVYVITNKHIISSMVNLAHIYFKKCDIKKENHIIFGLSEYLKPPTLIAPRPIINIYKDNKLIKDQSFDDAMNLVLTKEDNEVIYKSLFDDSIKFEYNL